ncbi:MAG TPA: thiocillin family RiPP [Blastocatellia bacterium]|nr:thiocillin family RiPP [Blastocatellia bacterium]
MNYTTQNQNDTHFNESEMNGSNKQLNDVLDLFAEELQVQHDLKLPQTVSTTSTVSTAGSCVGTASTFSTL